MVTDCAAFGVPRVAVPTPPHKSHRLRRFKNFEFFRKKISPPHRRNAELMGSMLRILTENRRFLENGGYLATFEDRFLKMSIGNCSKKYICLDTGCLVPFPCQTRSVGNDRKRDVMRLLNASSNPGKLPGLFQRILGNSLSHCTAAPRRLNR